MKTPYLYLDQDKLMFNIRNMARLARENHTALRPHCKSHKTQEIALLQIEYGSQGITASTLKEVAMLVAAGIKDITLAYSLIQEDSIKEYKQLMQKANLRTIVNSEDHARLLHQYFKAGELEVYLKVDSGLMRLGVQPGDIEITLSRLKAYDSLKIVGLLTHGGHSYQGKLPLAQIAKEEAYSLINNNPDHLIVSCGSTPTARELLQINGVDEARPGNYVFYDRTMIALGVAKVEEVSLFLITSVIAKYEDRLVIDAGSKALSSDAGVHGNKNITGFGLIPEDETLRIERLSEEHGIVKGSGISNYQLGDQLKIIPNHACSMVNLFDEIHVFKENCYQKTFVIKGRGH